MTGRRFQPLGRAAMLAACLALAAAGPMAALAAAPPAKPARARLNLDTPLKTLLADPRARALLARRMPGLTKAPASLFFRERSLREMSVDPHVGGLTPARLAEFERELAQIP